MLSPHYRELCDSAEKRIPLTKPLPEMQATKQEVVIDCYIYGKDNLKKTIIFPKTAFVGDTVNAIISLLRISSNRVNSSLDVYVRKDVNEKKNQFKYEKVPHDAKCMIKDVFWTDKIIILLISFVMIPFNNTMIVLLFIWQFGAAQLVPTNVIQLGFLHCRNYEGSAITIDYWNSAGAASVAVDRIKREGLLQGFEFNFTIMFDDCNEAQAAGKTIELYEDYKVDVIFGPTTNQAAFAAFVTAKYYDCPIIAWGLSNSAALDDPQRFPNAAIMSAGTRSLGVSLREVFQQFKWYQFVFAYSNEGDTEKCITLRNDIQDVIAYFNDLVILYSIQVTDLSFNGMTEALRKIKTRGRIIVTCMADQKGLRRRWLLSADDLGMMGDDYFYVFVDIKSKGHIIPMVDGTEHFIWNPASGPDENSTRSRMTFRKAFFICDMMGEGSIGANYSAFGEQVLAKMREPPFNCQKECDAANYSRVASYAGQLHDAVYAYATTVDRKLKVNPNGYRRASELSPYFPQTFSGASGDVVINSRGTRNPTLFLMTLDANDKPTIQAKIYVENMTATYTPLYKDETDLWVHMPGKRAPKDEPLCGFAGNLCPVNFFAENLAWVVALIVVIALTLIAAVLGIIYSIRMKRAEIDRLNQQWQIPFNHLNQIKGKQKGDHSSRSLQSGTSTLSSRTTVSVRTETRNYVFYTLQRELDLEPVVAKKHSLRPRLDDETCLFLRKLRAVDHENMNRFIGLCLDSPQMLSIWRFCSRGSIADIIHKATIQMDSFFIYSLIKDIVNGLAFIHSSFIDYHGMLTSKSCMIDDRWQVKISDFGLADLRSHDMFLKKDLLWSAPELLRNDNIRGTKEGDVYSLGIICAELITRKSVFNLEDRNEDPEEIIYMLKKGGLKSPRPSLDYDNTIEINPALLHMIRDCWTERPSERPDIETVRSQLRGMNSNRNDNLMDHVFNMLESYASTLEDEVSERTKELVEEKKKSDVLLYRMLPKTVAEKLKLGQTVEPETFEMVTIFFSDVVQFTTLASKCSPLQVVNLLNDLYTIFDGIIEKNDVYKVETIGDGYLCVSGLPHRNGNEHGRHIARLALGFMSSLDFFRIPHLPGERINLRIGINCGSVVAGVVGLTMPRYCLFGDAVNTASRMESNGKPGKIHLSSDANRLLTEVIGGFQTESRGEVIIKGKGVMETFWLIGETAGIMRTPEPKAEPPKKMYEQFQTESTLQQQDTLETDEMLEAY
ncbi:unnamed protein product [Caenorhabditis bovis]|uniref:Guanylate cyclase n=1 Tax=Caenorhabditis bovis TaxID=2654633 RepID=A0A8S1E976_9PELO|nr:unnamed protein product [Caenorhabditis bovis]